MSYRNILIRNNYIHSILVIFFTRAFSQFANPSESVVVLKNSFINFDNVITKYDYSEYSQFLKERKYMQIVERHIYYAYSK